MKTELPHGFVRRGATVDDAQIICDLVIACDIADYGEPDFSVQDLHARWRRSGFELERDAWLVFAPDGTVAAYAQAHDSGNHVYVDTLTCVHPGYREHGLEDYLIESVQAWTRSYAET